MDWGIQFLRLSFFLSALVDLLGTRLAGFVQGTGKSYGVLRIMSTRKRSQSPKPLFETAFRTAPFFKAFGTLPGPTGDEECLFRHSKDQAHTLKGVEQYVQNLCTGIWVEVCIANNAVDPMWDIDQSQPLTPQDRRTHMWREPILLHRVDPPNCQQNTYLPPPPSPESQENAGQMGPCA